MRLDKRLERLEQHFKEPEPKRVEPAPPEEFYDEAWWGKLCKMVAEDEGHLARLAEIRSCVQRELDAHSGGKSWSECHRAIEDFMLPERREIDGRRWEQNCLERSGFVPGNCCEDCGHSGSRHEPCQYCGGHVGWAAYLHKRIWSIDQLGREIVASHRLADAGFGGNPAELEGILERRMAKL